ncbi:hypothetical protein ITJ66_14110 [Plantibacter sp. VKM Ac-2885]|uniref:hypothetical protein n=1 Tax=Plantibacter sp. VKM Ac-2885 TaxID=2783828 RepID=UPI00188D451E|nr:hypothetical protein [Plantibacter sp. VKM Ac-2885]MBF4513620.1 hypothetical protein [Plantibacter sp. VKM Ac-2885]
MVTPIPRLFLHFFDLHYLQHAAARADRLFIEQEAELAVRLAVLVGGEVFIPASSYFESPICARIINKLSPLCAAGVISLIGGEATVQDYAQSKLDSYDDGGNQHSAYAAALSSAYPLPAFRTRGRSATRDLNVAWLDHAASPDFPNRLFGRVMQDMGAAVLDRWTIVPQLLGDRAFTPEYVSPILFGQELVPLARSRVASFINTEYFRSYSDELQAGYVTELNVLNAGYKLDNRYGNISYRTAQNNLRDIGLISRILDASTNELLDLRADPKIVRALSPALMGTPGADFAPVRLKVGIDLADSVAKLRAIPSGKEKATAYQRAVTLILDEIFVHSLGNGRLEQPMNEGRKRLDIVWRNELTVGFFHWIHNVHYAPVVFGECKNYKNDVANAEIDQLLGRMSDQTSRFGFLLCRRIRKRELLTKRCRDAYQRGQGIVIALDDDDVESLADLDNNPTWRHPLAEFLYSRVQEIVM